MSDQVLAAKDKRKISVLPQDVVDQIAAGEVVQRPQSVVKELLENCLDAGSTHITVKVERGGLTKLTIQDNGSGISKEDLVLAATRHATSKLQTVQDFHTLSTYGFRGEALASISMVSQLTITTRTASSPVGYTQNYRNGLPVLERPRPGARKPGTTIIVQDLFHNVPHRRKTYEKRENDEYHKILQVIQQYAIRYPHCGFCLERKHRQKGNIVDVNTSQVPEVQALGKKLNSGNGEATKEEIVHAAKSVIAHVLEPTISDNLSYFESSIPTKDKEFTYDATMHFTLPSYETKKSQFILFLNNRLVDFPTLKRSLEDVYTNFSKNHKPILVVSINVPGYQVDVNVHPSKRQVALMYQEELCSDLAAKFKIKLQETGQTFTKQSLSQSNPYSKVKRKSVEVSTEEEEESEQPLQKIQNTRKIPPSQLIRTNKASQSGALEPFLVSTQILPSSPTATQASNGTNTSVQNETVVSPHNTECALSNLDLSQPGAFALQCTCKATESISPAATVLVTKPRIRPKRVTPTECTYASIVSLRRKVNKNLDSSLAKDLRDAYFVGVLSHFRSLVQCGERLVSVNHHEMAKELFYQLALARFGGAPMADLGEGEEDGVDIRVLIAHTLQLEEQRTSLSSEKQIEMIRYLRELDVPLKTNEANQQMAEQATACLVENSELLFEYFSVQIKKETGRAILTGMPILLDGHSPEPHGLGLFLLRLATRVNWDEERLCFHGVCRELANYYSLLPTSDDESKTYIKHTLFPAISYMILPSRRFVDDGSFMTMTKLSKLYKIFERC